MAAHVLKVLLVSLTLLGVSFCVKDQTITRYLARPEYSVLLTLLKATGLDVALNGQGPYTVFAPNDAAFALVPNHTLAELQKDPTELSRVLQYHVLHEYLISPMVVGSAEKITLEGESLNLTKDSNGRLVVNGDTNTLRGGDIILNNGVLHPIDRVLFPPAHSNRTIAQQILTGDTRFKDLYMGLMLSELTSLLQTGEWTLFAPVDDAFSRFPQDQLAVSTANATYVYKELWKYHIVPGRRPASSLTDGGKIFALEGSALTVSMQSGTGVMIDNANVLEADIDCKNGVIHVIDTILIPDTLRIS